jgi:hypothetical protein
MGGAPAPDVKLERFIRVIDLALPKPNGENNRDPADYKVFIAQDLEKGGKNDGFKGSSSNSRYGSSGGGSQVGQKGAKKWTLNYWGFSPGIALQELVGLGVRSVLLASGRS